MRKTTLNRLFAAGATLATVTAGAVLLTPSSGAAPTPGEIQQEPSSSAPADLAGLKVLLTNDDSARGRDTRIGTDGKGLYEVRKALCAAGADVLVVAPWGQQSGASARITTPGFSPEPLTVEPVTPPSAYAGDCADSSTEGAVFGVCNSAEPCTDGSESATPADAVSLALSRFATGYWPEGPDVVVSGSNFGQNVGTTVNHSGTVGAVVTAHEHGVPAVAFSTAVPVEDLSQIGRMQFAETGEFAADLLAAMVERRHLTPDVVLNVNYPFVGEDETLGRPVATVVGDSDPLGATYAGEGSTDGGTYELVLGAPTEENRRGADTTALARNDISISALDAAWGATGGAGRLAAVVAAID
jgi:5'/3'-nucleotidase SurE